MFLYQNNGHDISKWLNHLFYQLGYRCLIKGCSPQRLMTYAVTSRSVEVFLLV